MDARSIAATAANGGKLTAATDLDVEYTNPEYHYNASLYEKRVYNGWDKAEPDAELRFGPNIKDWPEMPALTNDLLVKVCSYITDPSPPPTSSSLRRDFFLPLQPRASV